MALLLTLLGALGACSSGGYNNGKPDGSNKPRNGGLDLSDPDPDPLDLQAPSDLAVLADLQRPSDLASPVDMSVPADLAMSSDMAGGIISGGPCFGSPMGATAFRVHWYGSGGRATVAYDVHGLPDKSRGKVGVYGFGPGFTPQWVDTGLGPGGLELNSSDFIDIELSTAGLSRISNVTIALFGRSYATGSSGSFTWQTLAGIDGTATNSISNATPYAWYPGDATASIRPGDAGLLIRIKAGPSSNSLSVNKLEICMLAS